MDFKELKEKFIDTEIKDRQYRIISILVDGSKSSWKTDIKLDILTDEFRLKQFVVYINGYLNKKNVKLPYSIYKSKREDVTTENQSLYMKDISKLKQYLDSNLGELYG